MRASRTVITDMKDVNELVRTLDCAIVDTDKQMKRLLEQRVIVGTGWAAGYRSAKEHFSDVLASCAALHYQFCPAERHEKRAKL